MGNVWTGTEPVTPLRSQCYSVWHLLLASAVAFAIGYLTFTPDRVAKVGDHEVGTLQCEEDEAIGFDPSDPSPRELTCVHYEALPR